MVCVLGVSDGRYAISLFAHKIFLHLHEVQRRLEPIRCIPRSLSHVTTPLVRLAPVEIRRCNGDISNIYITALEELSPGRYPASARHCLESTLPHRVRARGSAPGHYGTRRLVQNLFGPLRYISETLSSSLIGAEGLVLARIPGSSRDNSETYITALEEYSPGRYPSLARSDLTYTLHDHVGAHGNAPG